MHSDTRSTTINGNVYRFINHWKNTRIGFKHESELLLNGHKISEHTSHYQNRTWERYEFQTSMLGAVRNMLDVKYEIELHHWKIPRHIERLSKAKKAEFEEYFNSLPEVLVLKELKRRVDDKEWEE